MLVGPIRGTAMELLMQYLDTFKTHIITTVHPGQEKEQVMDEAENRKRLNNVSTYIKLLLMCRIKQWPL